MEELKVRCILLGIRAVCTGVKVPYRFNSDASYRPGRLKPCFMHISGAIPGQVIMVAYANG